MDSLRTILSNEVSEVLQKIDRSDPSNRTASYSALTPTEKELIKTSFKELKQFLNDCEKQIPSTDLKITAGMGMYQTSGRVFPYIWGAFIPKEIKRVSHITPQLYVFRNSKYIGAGICPSDAAYSDTTFMSIITEAFSNESSLVQDLVNKGYELAPANEVDRGYKENEIPDANNLFHIRKKITTDKFDQAGATEQLLNTTINDLLPIYKRVLSLFREKKYFEAVTAEGGGELDEELISNWKSLWDKHYDGSTTHRYQVPEYLQSEIGPIWRSYRHVWQIGRREALKAIELALKGEDPGQARVEALVRGSLNRTNYTGAWRGAVVRNFSAIIKIIHSFYEKHENGCNQAELKNLLKEVKELSAKNEIEAFVTRFLCDLNPKFYLPLGSSTEKGLLLACELFGHEPPSKKEIQKYETKCALAKRLVKAFSDVNEATPLYEFDHFLYWLCNRTKGSSSKESNTRRYWRISCGERGALASAFHKVGVIAVAFGGEPDLSDYSSLKKLRDHLTETKSHKAPEYVADQLWNFKKDMNEGDYIFGYGASEVKLIGIVAGDYQHTSVNEWVDSEAKKVGDDFKHIRSVEWLTANPVETSALNPKLAKKLGGNCTIIEITETEAEEILAASDLKQTSEKPANSSPTPSAKSAESSLSLEELCAITSKAKDEIETIKRLLNSKRQIVFYGPPGTGKTFLTKHFINWFQQGNGLREFVQFHPSYAYEDFMEGLRPRSQNGQMEFRVESGVFKRFCDEARNHPDKNAKHVFVIDEINRGNIPQIFGELLSALEYREQAIRLPYSKEAFHIPENVYIIGTMNSADRSIAVVDYALRRRFKFIELKPDHIALKNYLQQNGCDVNLEHLIAAFKKLNDEIQKDRSKEYAIGHSYLMEADLSENSLIDISHFGIKPLLEEYFFDDPQKVERLDFLKLFEEQKKTSSGNE